MLRHIVLLIGVLAILLSAGSALGQGFGSAFTYQGYLSSSGGSVNGSCDFQFGLFTSVSGVGQIGSIVTTSNVTVSSGAFSALLDFGSVYDGGPRYLEIAVRCPAGSGSYTTLAPRQLLTPTPYAIHAGRAPWTGLVNVPLGFADGTDADLLAALTCAANEIPKWNGTAWGCAADVDTTYTAGTGLSLTGTTFRLLPGCSTNEIPKWNGTAWACAADVDTDINTTYTAGTGLNLSGTTFSLLPGCAANQIPKWNGTTWVCAADNTGSAWGLTGNAGTNPASNFIGTTDNQPLEFRVNNLRAFRIEPNATSPNLIGGYVGNTVTSGVYGAFIGGGGHPSTSRNRITDNYGVIGGGDNNQAGNNAGGSNDVEYIVIGGGYSNTASGGYGVIGGGASNVAGGTFATVAGGQVNYALANFATVGGGNTNRADALFATIGGGDHNTAYGEYAVLGGGYTNTATGNYTTVGGGSGNQATNYYATVGGGQLNSASGDQATVGGGGANIASGDRSVVCGGNGNTASGGYTFMGGGQSNVVSGTYAVMGGGLSNDVWGLYSVITGGNQNFVTDDYGTIGGGQNNQAGNNAGATTDAMFATVAGGYQNQATGSDATIGGGALNIASGSTATVAGGYENQATAWNATVGGGDSNLASGVGATIPGGISNEASGANSFAAGAQARSLHNGAFVWADGNGGSFSSTADNQFSVRASGGIRIYSSAGLSGVTLAAGSGSWASVSDRNVKENVTPVNPQAVLQSVAALPISSWNYIAQGADVQHLGPMAQDFYAAFGVGEDDTHISTIDADGVALAAIQGLYQVVQDKDQRIAGLESENAALKSRLDDVDERLAGLEGLAGMSPQAGIPLPVLAVVGLLALGGWFAGRRSQRERV